MASGICRITAMCSAVLPLGSTASGSAPQASSSRTHAINAALRGNVNRPLSRVGRGAVRVGAMFKQQPGESFGTFGIERQIADRGYQDRLGIRAVQIGVGAALQEQPRVRLVQSRDGMPQRGESAGVELIGRVALIEQHPQACGFVRSDLRRRDEDVVDRRRGGGDSGRHGRVIPRAVADGDGIDQRKPQQHPRDAVEQQKHKERRVATQAGDLRALGIDRLVHRGSSARVGRRPQDTTLSPPGSSIRGMRALVANVRYAWRVARREVSQFVFPASCALCQRPLPGDRAEPSFCGTCEAEVAVRVPACLRCGATIGPNLNPDGCPRCRGEGFRFESVLRVGVYDGRLRGACLQAKHPGCEPLSAAMGNLLWRLEAKALRTARIDLVVPVPRHWWQRLRRGTPAAAVLAEVWSERLGVPMASETLRKIRNTAPQAGLPPSTRRTNLTGAFTASKRQEIAGASILLADDVLTTGATANECTRALLAAGASRVVVAVIARGLGREPVPGA